MGLGSSRDDANPAPGKSDTTLPSALWVISFLSAGPVFSVAGRLYRFLDTIGQGSEATVYRCEDQNALQHAVKVLNFTRFPPTKVSRRVRKFDKEARLLKYMSQNSQHFLQLLGHEYKPMENTGYMVIELGEGNLRQFLVGAPMDSGTRRMLWKQIVTILKDWKTHASVRKLEALLDQCSSRVLVHADIKPDNMIMVNNVMKVTDLGLAFRLLSARQAAQRPTVRGTLGKSFPLPGFSLVSIASLKITWHRKCSLIEQGSNRTSGQQELSSTRWPTADLPSSTSSIETRKS